MQLIPLSEEARQLLADAAAAQREKWLKYERARRTLRLTGAFVTDYRAATIYPKLEAEGYCWDSSAEQWVNAEAEARRQRSLTAFMHDLHAGKFDAGEGEHTEVLKQTAASR